MVRITNFVDTIMIIGSMTFQACSTSSSASTDFGFTSMPEAMKECHLPYEKILVLWQCSQYKW
jgi:hypothetical protein